MTETRIELPWWPPDPDAPIGDDRARELVNALRRVARPVVDAAEADLQRRPAALPRPGQVRPRDALGVRQYRLPSVIR